MTNETKTNNKNELKELAPKGCERPNIVDSTNSVEEINFGEFSGHSSLKTVTIPNKVKRICGYAYSFCTGLQTVTIGNSVTAIGSYAFSFCTGLQTVTIGDSVREIGSYAFSNCSSLQSLTLPDSVTEIGNFAFSGCSSLEDLIIPEGVVKIGNFAFNGCSSLQSLTIPDSVKGIKSGAFRGCKKLKIRLSYETYLRLKNSIPAKCHVEIILPTGVQSLAEKKREELGDLHEFTLLNKLIEKKNKLKKERNRISYREEVGVFIYHSQGGDHRNLNGRAHDSDDNKIVCRHLAFEVLNQKIKGYHTQLDSSEKIKNTDSLRNNEFDKNRILYSRQSYHYFTINSFGKKIADCARKLNAPVPKDDDTNKDSSISESESHWYVCSDNHVMAVSIKLKPDNTVVVKFYDPNNTTSHVRALCRSIDDLSSLTLKDFIPNQNWYKGYFKNNKNMTFISSKKMDKDIPDVTIIDTMNASSLLAFYLEFSLLNNVNQLLKSLTNIKDNTQLHEILLAKREDGFPGFHLALKNGHTQAVKDYMEAVLKTELKHLNKLVLLTAKASEGGDSGFYMALQNGHTEAVKAYCESVIDSGLTEFGKVILLSAKRPSGCAGLEIALKKGHTAAVKAYIKAVVNSGLACCYIEELLEATKGEVDSPVLWKGRMSDDNKFIRATSFPSSVKFIGSRAFEDFTNLQSINIPSRVTSIGRCAFVNCTSLNDILIPNSVTEIGNGAFNGCTSLQSLTLPDSLTKIGYGAFEGCAKDLKISLSYNTYQRLRKWDAGTQGYQIPGIPDQYIHEITVPEGDNSLNEKEFQELQCVMDRIKETDPQPDQGTAGSDNKAQAASEQRTSRAARIPFWKKKKKIIF